MSTDLLVRLCVVVAYIGVSLVWVVALPLVVLWRVFEGVRWWWRSTRGDEVRS